MIRRIRTTSYFDRRYKKLLPTVKTKAKEKELVFRNNPFDPHLRTHKLHGAERGMWAFWIDFHHRIKFIFLGEEEVLFLDVGTHDIYK